MKIGFDLDRIFINYPPFIPGELIEKLYKEKSNGTLRYRIPSKFEQIIRKLSHFYLLRPPMQENIDVVKTMLDNKKNSYYLISSRFGFLEKQTDVVIKRYGLNKLFSKLYFNIDNKQPHFFKNSIIKKLRIDVYIDDDLSLLHFLAQKNKKTHFFWLNNTKTGKIADNITAITHISQLQP